VTDVPVLIVGGGPVGLTASILLSHHGVPSLLVERHPGTAVHPKARGINARTMEMYRQLGVEQAIRDAGLPPERARFIVWTRTLAGEELERRVPGRNSPENQAITPVRNCLCAQDYLEPVLRRHAEKSPLAALRFDTELTSFEQDADGVSVSLVDRVTGAETRTRAQYVIAADGAQSRVRRALGVTMLGKEDVYESVNVLLKAISVRGRTHAPLRSTSSRTSGSRRRSSPSTASIAGGSSSTASRRTASARRTSRPSARSSSSASRRACRTFR
jgi:2-polyprenyl-6-methoxyphenol hydroxylase-like FAD-dependent oxidoreductase